MSRDSFRIASRFHGPPNSGNGGYVCGRLAQWVAAPAVSARLLSPPPLDTTLDVRSEDGLVTLYAGEAKVAQARALELDLDPPSPPSPAQVVEAARAYAGFAEHPFPSCFVCGPEREPGDGLCVFAGPVAGRDLTAAPWIPDPTLAGADGGVAPEFIWAALDCPGAFAFGFPACGTVLLGELHVELRGEVRVGEACCIIGWELGQQGRKHFTGTALFGESGDCRGVARATWIEVAPKV